MKYKCNKCGAEAYYDGRMGDGPVLICGCDEGPWVDDGRGGFHWPTGAEPVEDKGRPKKGWSPGRD